MKNVIGIVAIHATRLGCYAVLAAIPFVQLVAGQSLSIRDDSAKEQSVNTEGKRSNLVVAGVRQETAYDDNVYGVPSKGPKTHDELVSVQPHLSLALSRPHTEWSLNYSPSFTFSQNTETYNTSAQNLGSSLTYRFTRRFSLSGYGTLNVSDTPFDQYRGNQVLDFVPVQVRPNEGVIAASGEQRTLAAGGMAVNYALDAHSTVEFGGMYATTRFKPPAGSVLPGLLDSTTYGGRASYMHRFSRRNTAGAEYEVMQFSSVDAPGTVLSHVVALRDQFAVSAHQSISFFAGPQVSQIDAVPVGQAQKMHFSWAAGGTYGVAVGRTQFKALGDHRVNDGGGLGVAVQLTRASLEISRPFGRAWSSSVAGSYNWNNPLVVGYSGQKYTYWDGHAYLARHITHNFSAEVSYWHSQENGLSALQRAWVPRNRVILAFVYDFTHPLGK